MFPGAPSTSCILCICARYVCSLSLLAFCCISCLALFILGMCMSYIISLVKCKFAGGAVHPSCPYRCVSEEYRMPNCYKPFEELMYTFGGPWTFAFLMSSVVVLLALLFSSWSIKLVRPGCSDSKASLAERPHLLSLSEVF